MKKIYLMKIWKLFLVGATVWSLVHPSEAGNLGELRIPTLREAREQFAHPPAAYRPAPLYVWNDEMREEEIARQLDELNAMGFGGVFIHPRPGLVTPYLSDRWLELWRFTAEEAKQRGMVTYLYDENSYPSGFAGGFVPDQMPDAAKVSLRHREFTRERFLTLVLNKDSIALYKVTDADTGAYERLPIPALSGEQTRTAKELNLEPATYILYSRYSQKPSPWFGGKTYVDLMRRDVTDKFLEVTFGAYDKVLSDLYGKQVLACFTDEPQVAGGWSPMIPPAFKERWGYDILDFLPSIHADIGEWRKVRHDYADTILRLFMVNFVKPYSEACEARGIAFSGHVWEHGWPRSNHNPDTMSFYAWQRWPGIDCLGNKYSEETNAQFGNYRANKELDSIGNQFGRVRRLSETYGAGGWDMTLEDVKRIGDHLFAGGINLINPHLSYYTIRGARKRDHPQSFSYHAPYWEAFHIPMDYQSRLSWALSGGKVKNPLLIIEPTVTMWMYNWSNTQAETLENLGSAFQRYITELGAAQVGFDLGSEPVMADHARVEGKQLVVGECAYETVILPPGLECLAATTVKLLETFAANGGTIISRVGVPPYVDGRPSDALRAVQQKAGASWIEEDLSAVELKQRWGNGGVMITAGVPRDGRVFHYVREFEDGLLIYVSNTSLTEGSKVSAEVSGSHAERWNAVSGAFETVDYRNSGSRSVTFDFELPPAGSRLLAVYGRDPGQKTVPSLEWAENTSPLKPVGELKIEMLEPNVLTLDYVDLVLKGESSEGLYYYDAQTRIYRAHGFDKNPWESAVQFKDEIIRKDRFPADSGFELCYPFTIDGFESIPPLKLVIERGDFYTVSVNGKSIEPDPDKWWLDRAFRVYTLKPEWLKKGKNLVSTTAVPFSLRMEAEPIYLLGDFNLKNIDKGFSLVPTKPLRLGPWSDQGRPLYADKVAYSQTFTIDADDTRRHFVELPDWKGTAARVDVNGKPAGYILWQPWKLDISEALKPGKNTVTVVVFGSLKNLLGPHHAGKLDGFALARPSVFWQHPKVGQPPGSQYDVIGYGLRKPFLVY